MASTTAARPQERPSAAPTPNNGTWLLIACAVVVALVVGALLGSAFFGGSSRTLTGSYGSVQIKDAYDAKVTFINGNDAGCLRRVGSSGHGRCFVFAEVPGTPRPVKGELVHAVIMLVENPDGSGYEMATLWPSSAG